MLLLQGKPVAEEVYRKLLLEISLLPVVPKLVVLLVGDHPASETYVKTKTKKCQALGLLSETRKFSSDVTEEDLLKTIQDSGFNSNHVSSKELNLIIKLHQEDYLPNWRTIATSFKDRSMDQIKAILDYFGKTHCMPNTENSISFEHKAKIPAVVEGISMFLNPKDYTNLSMTAKNVTFRTKEETWEHEQESTSYCSIQ